MLLSVNKAFVQLEGDEDGGETEEKAGRYLHGGRVTKHCGMLQVADPGLVPERLPAALLHPRSECF